MACGQLRVVRCGFWGVALGYGGYGRKPNARRSCYQTRPQTGTLRGQRRMSRKSDPNRTQGFGLGAYVALLRWTGEQKAAIRSVAGAEATIPQPLAACLEPG